MLSGPVAEMVMGHEQVTQQQVQFNLIIRPGIQDIEITFIISKNGVYYE